MLSASGAAVGDAVVIKTEPVDPDPDYHDVSPRQPSPASVAAAAAVAAAAWEPPCWSRARCKIGPQMSPPELLVCEVCQAEFPNFEILLLHKLCHFNTRHVCYVCDCYFASTDSLVVHLATIHHNLSKASGYYKAEAERAFACCICLQRFSSNKMLDLHLNSHLVNDENFFGCKVCALSLASYTTLLAHLNSADHRHMKVKLQSIFVCFDCRRVFATRDSYAMHMMLRAQTETCDNIRDTPPDHVIDQKPIIHPAVAMDTAAVAGAGDSSDDQSAGLAAVKPDVGAPRRHAAKRLLSSRSSSASASPPVFPTSSAARAMFPGNGLAPTSLTCIVCWAVLDSCDGLAMHMMEEHTYRRNARARAHGGAGRAARGAAGETDGHTDGATHASPDSTKRKLSVEHPPEGEEEKRGKLSPADGVMVDNEEPMCGICNASFRETVASASQHRGSPRSKSTAAETDGASGRASADHARATSAAERHGSLTATDGQTGERATRHDKTTRPSVTPPQLQSPEPSNMPEYGSDASSSSVTSASKVTKVTSGRQSMLCLMRSHGELGGGAVVDHVLANVDSLSMCKYCKLIFTDRTIFYLHMGLHNLNNPWQCNLCGKVCRDLHDFSSHVIHF